ncbi:MAG: TonB-dependent receptor [Flavobacterium sp.]|nr:TonB-dependent receptor [Flavobacterium sp.]
MSTKIYFLSIIVCLCQVVCAQQNLVLLNQVIVSDLQLKNFTNTKSKQVLNDSIIEKNQISLTSILNFNSVVYFKENGLGMIASPSFRGTTAQQTAVIWNGININSQLNGQTDFNLISARDFNSITVQSGGSSTLYGSSAIGGSIHLNNNLKFNELFKNELHVNYGSFNTIGVNYKTAFATDKLSNQISISRNSSDNDYPFLEYADLKNENGKFSNTSMNANFGYKFNSNNLLKFYSQFFDSQRYLSPSLGGISKAKYQDFNTRNLLEYNHYSDKFSHKIKIAFLSEKYKYFQNYSYQNYETSSAETLITKYDLAFKLSNKTEINSIIDFTKTKGFGTSIGENSRNIGAAILLFKSQVFKKLLIDGSVRKEQTNNYESPILYGFGMKFDALNQYIIKINASKNFRIPTFNDLYWNGLGNKNLMPENSKSYEFSQEIKFKNFQLSATAYYSNIENLIQWTPINNIWTPKNVTNVTNYGIEIYTKMNHQIGKNSFALGGSYAFTKSKNDETNFSLVYVPKHKINGEFNYYYKKIAFNYQYLFNGYVFTSSDNYYFLKEYQIHNLGIDYDFGKIKTYKIGFQVLNLYNENYQNVQARPMPGRNFNLNINIKF